MASLVTPGCHWLDVGSGAALFPENPKQSQQLASRCGLLVGVDPDGSLDDNPYLDRRARCVLEDFNPGEQFDVVTLRLVAEHLTEPEAALAALHRLVRGGGKVVVYTIHRWSPRTLLRRQPSGACRLNTCAASWPTFSRPTALPKRTSPSSTIAAASLTRRGCNG